MALTLAFHFVNFLVTGFLQYSLWICSWSI